MQDVARRGYALLPQRTQLAHPSQHVVIPAHIPDNATLCTTRQTEQKMDGKQGTKTETENGRETRNKRLTVRLERGVESGSGGAGWCWTKDGRGGVADTKNEKRLLLLIYPRDYQDV